jgi:hypothetical protein
MFGSCLEDGQVSIHFCSSWELMCIKLDKFNNITATPFKWKRSIIYLENQVQLVMFSQFIINLLHYNCYSYGSSLVQEQLKFSTLNSRSGSQLAMQYRSSKLDEEKIHKFLEERNTNYKYYLRLLSQYWNEFSQIRKGHPWKNKATVIVEHHPKRKKVYCKLWRIRVSSRLILEAEVKKIRDQVI